MIDSTSPDSLNSPDGPLDELISDLLEGELSDADRARLHQLLAGDAQAVQRYVRLLAIHAMLQNNQLLPLEDPVARLVLEMSQREPARTRVWLYRPQTLAMTIAALVMVLVIGAMVLVSAPNFTRTRPIGSSDATPLIVAQLTGLHDAQWAESQVGTHFGAFLVRGHRLELLRGVAEITFRSGATMLVEGPSSLTITSDNSAALQAGKLQAVVPPPAIGFIVETPELLITDLGTEFGVAHGEDGASEVYVEQGEVAVRTIANAADFAPLTLTAGRGLRVASGIVQRSQFADAGRRFAIVRPAGPEKTVSLRQGVRSGVDGKIYTGAEDTTLISWAPDWNFGAGGLIDAGQEHDAPAASLLRFDLSPLRGRVAKIHRATLYLTLNEYAPHGLPRAPGKLALHRVSDANAPWQGGANSGGKSPDPHDGLATWNSVAHAERRWAGAAGLGTPGVDFMLPALAEVDYETGAAGRVAFGLTGDLSFLEAWIAGQSNGGFLLRETTNGNHNRICFDTAESADVRRRPELVLVYTEKPPPLRQAARPPPPP